MLLRLALQDHGTHAVISAHGELDVSTSGMLMQAVRHAYEGGYRLVLADLTHLEFADSSGISALTRCHRDAVAHGRGFALVAPNDQVRHLVRMLGLHDTLVLADTAEEALTRLPGL